MAEPQITDTMKGLKKIFSIVPNSKKELHYIPEDEQNGYMDATDCIMVIPKTYRFRDIMQNFEWDEQRPISIDYAQRYPRGVYSVDFMRRLSDIIRYVPDKWMAISTASDAPLTLETVDMKIILAHSQGDVGDDL